MKHIIIVFLILLGIVSCKTKGGDTQQDAAYTPVTTEDTSSVQNDTLSAAEVSLSQLQGTKWKIVSPIQEGEETTWLFSNDYIIEQSKLNNKNYEFRSPFYVTNSLPLTFVQSQVGKVDKGIYLVMYIGKKIKRMDWYTITSIDWNTGDMYLFRQPAEDEVGGGPVTIHFKLISKGNHRRSRR